MPEIGSKFTAKNLMKVHGLRAHAVVQERILEARQRQDTAELQRWQNVDIAIAELRRSNHAAMDSPDRRRVDAIAT